MASLKGYCRKLTDQQLYEALKDHESSDDPTWTLFAQQVREVLLEQYLVKIETGSDNANLIRV